MTAVVVSALWVGGGLLLALFVGRLIGMAPDPDAPDVGDYDLWGCDECEQEAAERAARLRHPSSRVTCPDFVPEEWL